MTFREASTAVDRNLFHTYFRHILSAAGHPVAAYFPSDNSPFFTVARGDDGWKASATNSHRNKFLLNGSPLDASDNDINDGSKLELYSGGAAAVVASFVFRFA